MASGSSLYGAPRPKSKSTAISLSSTSIHALSAEISLARLRLSSESVPGRSRPTKTKSLFAGSNKNVFKRAAKDLVGSNDGGGRTSEQLGGGVSERDLARSKKKLKQKAKLYDAMKRGDFNDDNGEGLVDFDRKWAEHPSDEESENGEGANKEDDDDDDDGDEIVEYEDEFGRTRKGKKSYVEKEKRREAAAKKAAEEAAARDAVPEGLIIGNTIQTGAFVTANFSAVPTSSMLSEALPPEEEYQETHYDASKEVRTKGVGFYQFSTNSKERAVEMEELMNERERTAGDRKKAEEKKKRRREEIEARREEVKRRRRVKVGENWLEGFMGEIEVGDKEGEGKKTE